MDSDLELDRLEAELSLLEAMYSKELLAFDRRTRELSYTASIESGGKITIRIPDGYPATKEHPQIILARDVQKQDLREHMTAFMASFTACSPDNDIEEIGEILDQVLERFCELVESGSQNEDKERQDHVAVAAQAQKTVIIWLHHLLALSKRKLALHPTNSRYGTMSGLTKPGYPGIMVFSGPQQAVNEHVTELRSLNWQAFSVRYEEEVSWKFESNADNTIVEVETLSEATRLVEEGKREDFLKAVGVK